MNNLPINPTGADSKPIMLAFKGSMKIGPIGIDKSIEKFNMKNTNCKCQETNVNITENGPTTGGIAFPDYSSQIIEVKPEGRRYLPTLSELVDRLSITQLKEIFLKEHRGLYAQEIQDIMHDIDLVCRQNNLGIDARTIRAIIVTSQMNLHIWHNESNWRKGIRNGNNLELTHGLNSQRNFAKNIIQELVGGRKDYKLDNVEAYPEWVPSWNGK